MKYKEGKVWTEEKWESVSLEHLSEAEAMTVSGKVCCPWEECKARLFAVHSWKNGGRTVHFKAANHAHEKACPFRIENYKANSINVAENGYFTEKQVHDFVRMLYKDTIMPLEEKNRQKEQKKNKTNSFSNKKTEEEKLRNKTSNVGKIISGEFEEGAVKGRMSRRYKVESADMGRQIGVYGYVRNMSIDEYGQLHVKFQDERYENIEVLIGEVYKNSNPSMYSYLSRVLKYYYKNKQASKNNYFVAGGMVNSYNGQLVIEIQAKHGFIIDGLSISKLMVGEVGA